MNMFSKLRSIPYLWWISRLAVGCVMIWFSAPKVRDPVTFLKLLKQYDLFGPDFFVLMNLVAIVIPIIELLGGLALILGITLRGVSCVMTLMLIGFTGVVFNRAWHIHESQNIPFTHVAFDCGCGVGEQIIWIKMIENSLLILGCLLILIYRKKPVTLIPPTTPNS